MKKIASLIIATCSTGLAAHAQLIDAFNGESLSGYTTTSILDASAGGGNSISFDDSSGALMATYVGATSTTEQALFLTPTALPVGDFLLVNVAIPDSSTLEQVGLAISSTATPLGTSAINGYNTRTTFDWATIAVRPSDSSIQEVSAISGGYSSGDVTITGVDPATISKLYIENNGGGSFSLGYVDSSGNVIPDDTITFSGTSTAGDAIGIYGDLRATGTSLGSFSDLTIASSVPEPTSLALFGLGLAGVGAFARRKAK